MTTIWSRRHTPAKGNHWVAERKTSDAELAAWMGIFRNDEPGVIFVESKRRPAPSALLPFGGDELP